MLAIRLQPPAHERPRSQDWTSDLVSTGLRPLESADGAFWGQQGCQGRGSLLSQAGVVSTWSVGLRAKRTLNALEAQFTSIVCRRLVSVPCRAKVRVKP